jgi:hypothetical protein
MIKNTSRPGIGTPYIHLNGVSLISRTAAHRGSRLSLGRTT